MDQDVKVNLMKRYACCGAPSYRVLEPAGNTRSSHSKKSPGVAALLCLSLLALVNTEPKNK